MTSTFLIVEQHSPPSNEPFRILEMFTTSEGYRTRVCGGTYATFQRAQGEVRALTVALEKQANALKAKFTT